jgi:hypothetical protein
MDQHSDDTFATPSFSRPQDDARQRVAPAPAMTNLARLKQDMAVLAKEFEENGVSNIFAKLEAPSNNLGVQSDRMKQVTSLGLDFCCAVPELCRKEIAKLKQVPYIARRKASTEFLHVVPGNFAVADPKREGFWRAFDHVQKCSYLESWLQDLAEVELHASKATARTRWLRKWTMKIDLADEMRKEFDAQTATQDDLAVYLHLATEAGNLRRSQQRAPKRLRRTLHEDFDFI